MSDRNLRGSCYWEPVPRAQNHNFWVLKSMVKKGAANIGQVYNALSCMGCTKTPGGGEGMGVAGFSCVSTADHQLKVRSDLEDIQSHHNDSYTVHACHTSQGPRTSHGQQPAPSRPGSSSSPLGISCSEANWTANKCLTFHGLTHEPGQAGFFCITDSYGGDSTSRPGLRWIFWVLRCNSPDVPAAPQTCFRFCQRRSHKGPRSHTTELVSASSSWTPAKESTKRRSTKRNKTNRTTGHRLGEKLRKKSAGNRTHCGRC